MKAITAVLLISAPVWAQQVAGTVESVRADAQQLTLKTDWEKLWPSAQHPAP